MQTFDTVYWDTLWSTVFVGTWIWSGESRFQWQSVEVCPISIFEPQALTLLGEARFITWHLRRPFKGNANRIWGIFGATRKSGLLPCTRFHQKKSLVPHSSSRWDEWKISKHTSIGRVCRYTDLVGCVLVPVAVGWGCPTWKVAFMSGMQWLASSSLKGPSPQALTLLRGARFIT